MGISGNSVAGSKYLSVRPYIGIERFTMKVWTELIFMQDVLCNIHYKEDIPALQNKSNKRSIVQR